MPKMLWVGLSLLLALGFAGGAVSILINCILPWLREPVTTHVTVIIAGIQFGGATMFLPFALLILSAIAMAAFATWLLGKRP